MRNYSYLLAGLLLLVGCQKPASKFTYSALENLPPKTAQRAQEGGLAIWALAAVSGRVEFYLLAPRDSVPERLAVRMGGHSLQVEKRAEIGGTYFVWSAQLGKEGVLKPVFDEPMLLEVGLPGGHRRCMTISGLGTESYPVLNMCYFDISWEFKNCS